MTEESNHDQWLAQIKQGVQDDLGDRVWREGILTDFVEDVAWWLRNDENQSDALAIRAAAGLIRYGIETEANLTTVAGSPPDDEHFRKKLKEEGVPALVCDLLFKKYLDGGMYTLGPSQQQTQQQPNYSEEIKRKIEHIETMMIESKTDEKDMSKASTEFATDLLNGLSISWRTTDANMNVGIGSAVGNFQWDQTLLKGGKAKISENDGTPAALEWLFGKLEQGLAVDGEVLGIRDMKGKKLASIKADHKEANGKSDGCVAEESKLVLCERTQEPFYTYGMALVEMKTNGKPMTKAQMLLQLAAFSRQSTWGQSTVLLGTDGNEKWYLLQFEAFNSMSLTQYRDGRQCLNEFESLLKSLKTRDATLQSSKRAKLAPVSEEQFEVDQNLTGVSRRDYVILPGTDGAAGGSQEAVDKAIENEAFLHRLANALAESPLSDGVRPSLPEWSLAKNVVPSYYM